MNDDNRWNDRERQREQGWREGREHGDDRGRRMHSDRRHEGPAGYNDSGPAQGGWSFGDAEQGGERGQGYERMGYGRGPDQPYGRDPGAGSGETWSANRDYGYGPYTPYGYRGRNEYDDRGRGGRGTEAGRRGREDRSWLDRAGERIAEVFGNEGEHRGRGPKGYRRSDDRIREDINDRLTDDAWLDASDIDVEVKDGEVTLSGTVRSRDDKRRAENIAESVSGVTHAQNNLRQAPPRADADAPGFTIPE